MSTADDDVRSFADEMKEFKRLSDLDAQPNATTSNLVEQRINGYFSKKFAKKLESSHTQQFIDACKAFESSFNSYNAYILACPEFSSLMDIHYKEKLRYFEFCDGIVKKLKKHYSTTKATALKA